MPLNAPSLSPTATKLARATLAGVSRLSPDFAEIRPSPLARRRVIRGMVASLATRWRCLDGFPDRRPVAIPRKALARLAAGGGVDPAGRFRFPLPGGRSIEASGAELVALARDLVRLEDARRAGDVARARALARGIALARRGPLPSPATLPSW